ncbi:MAG: hypothetical protein AB8B74_05025 [Crocinitomicaceae bacterium]
MNFSKTEALSILGIIDSEEAADAYEELLFEWKQKYLSNIPPIPVINAHLKKIERLNQAASLFLKFDEFALDTINVIPKSLNLVKYLEAYQPLIMQMKLNISKCSNGMQLSCLLKGVVEIEQNMLNRLVLYSLNVSDHLLDQVKISNPTEYYNVEKELKKKEISETEIKNYLRAELKFGTFPFDSFLLNEVLKALKQLQE